MNNNDDDDDETPRASFYTARDEISRAFLLSQSFSSLAPLPCVARFLGETAL